MNEEPYDYVDAREPIKIEPYEEALYVEIRFDAPIPNEDGSWPEFYVANIRIHGCFEKGTRHV